MAGPDFSDILAQLNGGVDKSAAETDPYSPLVGASNQFNQALYQKAGQTTQGAGQALVAGLLSGLVGGGAENLSTGYQAQQHDLANSALQDFMKGGVLTRPDGISPSVFSRVQAIAGAKQANDIQQKAEEQQQLQQGFQRTALSQMLKSDPAAALQYAQGKNIDTSGISAEALASPQQSLSPALLDTFGKFGLTPEQMKDLTPEEANTLQKLLATKIRADQVGGTSGADPQDKIDAANQKEEDKMRKEWEAPLIQKQLETLVPFKQSVQGLKTLNSAQADMALKELYQRTLTPGAATIREGIFNKITDTQNPADKWAGKLSYWLGGGDLDPRSRDKLIEAMQTVANEKIGYYKKKADSYKGIADRRGLDFTNIVSNYDDLFGGQDSAPKDPHAVQPGESLEAYKARLRGAGL